MTIMSRLTEAGSSLLPAAKRNGVARELLHTTSTTSTTSATSTTSTSVLLGVP